jgi:hypothetical protein
MLWIVIDRIADGSPDIVFPPIILGFSSYVPLFLNPGVVDYMQCAGDS